MDLTTLPPIGRNGLINSVRNLSSMVVTGWRTVDPTATFYAGQLAVMGASGVTNVTAVGNKPIGVFFTHNNTTFYRPSFEEEHTFGENTSAPTVIYVNPYVKASSYIVTDGASTTYTESTDYSINATNGAITNLGVAIGATATVYVTYLYKDLNLSGINQVLGSGCAALLEGVGDIATLMYDTTATWTLNADVQFTSAGYFTTAVSGSATIGKVMKVPTASDPELYVKLNLA